MITVTGFSLTDQRSVEPSDTACEAAAPWMTIALAPGPLSH